MAQTDVEIQQYGREVFEYFTDSTVQSGVEFVRVKRLKELIDIQPISAREKSARRYKVEQEFDDMYEAYYRKTKDLYEQYYREQQLGTQFEYLGFEYESPGQSRDIYEGVVRFLYKSMDVQNMVEFHFRFYYTGKGFALLTPVEERF